MAQAQVDSKYSALPKINVQEFVTLMVSNGAKFHGSIDKDLNAKIIVDSRKIEISSIFIAIKGEKSDGHQYLSEAQDKNASLVVCEAFDKNLKTPQLVVSSSRAAWAWACSLAWGHPSQKIKMIGVTGTNGKTSTVWMIKGILDALGTPTSTIGTLGFYLGKNVFETKHTTPDPDVLFGMIQFAVDSKQAVLAMEVASHAIQQEKLSPIRFQAAAWTSFSQDHLDFHKSMKDYFETKSKLFSKLLAPNALSLLNSSIKPLYSDYSVLMPKDAAFYSADPSFDTSVTLKPSSKRGHTDASCHWLGFESTFTIPFIGKIFAENFLAAIRLSSSVVETSLIVSASQKISDALLPVPGRLQPALSNKFGRPLVLVEHAHTPDALEKSIEVARSITTGKLVVVFGCGGDRDKTKRPVMGKIAETLCDHVFVTSDNPRSEDPAKIIQDIQKGQSDFSKITAIEDRELAIKEAILQNSLGDTVLLAGKGHETYQIIGDKILSFSDFECASKYLVEKRTWCVLGAGMSGVSAALFLRKNGDSVVVSDNSAVGEENLKQLSNQGIKVFQNSTSEECLTGVNGLVVSPGVSGKHNVFLKALQLNLPILTEIDLGFEKYDGTVVAVTGTNGKSTICALAEFSLNELGISTKACGNIGLPPTALEGIERVRVCELSSYQLEFSKPLQKDAAVFSSFSFDHLARHGTISEYFRCKWLVAGGLKPSGVFVLTDDVYTVALKERALFPNCRTVVLCKDSFTRDQFIKNQTSSKTSLEFWLLEGETLLDAKNSKIKIDSLKIFGQHNLLNAATVYICIEHLKLAKNAAVFQAMAKFTGLPYRCQLIFHTPKKRPVFNDSKSTNVESTLVALSSMQTSVVLLLGGAGKGESFEDIKKFSDKIDSVFAFGAFRSNIFKDLSKHLKVTEFETMASAVKASYEYASKNDLAVLFSPACASFDEFKNFEHRGQVFNELILSMG